MSSDFDAGWPVAQLNVHKRELGGLTFDKGHRFGEVCCHSDNAMTALFDLALEFHRKQHLVLDNQRSQVGPFLVFNQERYTHVRTVAFNLAFNFGP